ncbi:type II toxin-antitoxin system Phd/YefM family antitoxin [Gryllotalpicola ginsengisoli]|uniref:type II toxin-antitoxin system Phd/YefM family antitoxin n=1 Tax=Gryllotalpicola ginsengisoli TaxID=444608 RepID=UPI0003B5BE34|nr:type II toxin-antitoxin system prevent-host-death family antitoxin [Gryllotalpicola ginsengisoli]
MTEVGIRALKQNASAVIADVAQGQTVTITDRGRPVARLSPLPSSPLDDLAAAGRIRRGRGRVADLPAPEPGAPLSPELSELRDGERY